MDFICDSKITLKFLQKVDLSKNKITELKQLQSPSIVRLVLDENEIAKCDIKHHPSLKFLSLNKNKLTSGEGISRLTTLEELSIQENETLTTLKGLENMTGLKKLNLNGCKIESLDSFPMLPALEELVLDGNSIASIDELPKLGHLRGLQKLSMQGTPLAEEKGDDLKKEILIALMESMRSLKEINGEPFDDEQVKDAKETKE